MKTKRNPDWAMMLGELEAFQKTYGHLRVDARYPALADWLLGIRGRLETLSYCQILDLDNLGFFDRRDQHWLDRYAQLKGFRDTAGHCMVTDQPPGNRSLSSWVQKQRSHAAKGMMQPWRRNLLTDLEFCFEIAHRGVSAEFAEVLKRLKRYKKRFGHCNVPSTWREDRRLVHWVSVLRANKESLETEKVAELDAVGFEWDPLYARWERRFRELEAFKAKHGHCLVSKGPYSLRNWVGNIRQHKVGLTEARVRRLDALGFDWARIETVWNTRYEELLAFERKHGHTYVPRNWAENPELANWVIGQRNRRGKPTPEQVALLEKVGFDWDPYETAWMQHYEELEAFRRKNGHCKPRADTSTLGKWVSKQRIKAHKMAPHRKKLLNEIGFHWGEKIDEAWMRHYEELKAYHIKHGRGPSQAELLGKWVSNQRTAYKKGRITPEHKKLLTRIGFVWRVCPRGRPPGRTRK